MLLPALQRDAIETVLRSFMTGALTVPKVLLAVTVALSVGLSLTLVWLVVKQLTQFYFHANHISRYGAETFTPRFTLTGLRLPSGELSAASTALAGELRSEQRNLDLLVPANSRGRDRIDRQLDAYAALREDERTDAQRVEALLELAASRTRSLLEEAVKVELGLARHVLRLQVVVLRYVKALLVVVTTVLATYIASAATGAATTSTIADQRWIAATYCMWAPVVIVSATAPVRWIESLLRAEGATGSSVRNDPEFTRVENIASCVAIVAWAMAAAASIALLFAGSTSPRALVAGITTTACSAALLAVAFRLWRRSEPGGPVVEPLGS
ncbi:MAG: hypothetical protein JWL72_641 [Ilumatobacteraceae bacterium]|nr:hypothetical protein [Ilumatobacteraceae bacterium]